MTLPNERYRSLVQAKEFLRTLLDPKLTPRVPKAIRKEAYWRLRHFPSTYELETIAKKCPKLLENDMKGDK